MNMPGGFMEALPSDPIIGFSLLPVWVLVGLFQYLNRFTGRVHFRTWTSGWLFYALFLTLSVVPPGLFRPDVVNVCRNWCIATGALLMLWGSFQFINVPARQRLIAMMVIFNLIWSCATADDTFGQGWGYFPAFAFLALASGFTAFCFFSRRTHHTQKGAALLSFAFALWSLFLLCTPFLRGSETILYTGFMAASVLQLFIAISMMVLVLEETRGRLQSAVDNFSREAEQSSRFQTEAETAMQNYRTLFDNSRDAVAIVAADNLEIFELNAAARKLFAVKERCSGVSLLTYCSLLNQKQREPKEFLAALPKNPEVELTVHDGVKVHARVRGQRIRYGGKKAHQIIFSDVAERASIARQIRGGGKMSALGQVISGVAHELNNPLAAIKGYTDLLLLTARLDEQSRSALLKVSQESNRAARLVRDLLAFARPETPRIEPLNVNELIQRFVEQRQGELETKQIKVEFDLGHDTALALASGDQIQQVLAHLLNNACEALDETDEDRTIEISTRNIDSRIQIRVEDSGPGIEPNVLPRIFEPFFTTKPVGTGTGLGLSVCYSILLQHRGKIAYEPSLLGGACFVVELPAAFSAVQPVTNIATADFRAAGSSKSGKILVVDDEPSVVALLNDMLTLLGHRVTAEHSPYDALRKIETEPFDAVLSDFRMPGMTGGDLYQRAAEVDRTYQSRFLFLTGDMMDPETHQFFQSTNVPCLLKPFQLSALQTELAKLLEKEGPSRASIAG
jgi:two-component system, NtrC family, sensor kinase